MGSTIMGEVEISIIIPAYNADDTLCRAVDSVISQTYSKWRLVIVDDGSSDATKPIGKAYARDDGRITFLTQENAGVALARNRGVGATSTELVGFLDADDELYPDYLQSMVEFIGSHPGYDIYHPNITVVAPGGEKSPFCDLVHQTSFGLRELLDECVIAAGGSIIRRALFDRLAGFRTGIHCEDYDFWLRAAAQGARALYLPEQLYVYHLDLPERRSADALAGASGLVEAVGDLLRAGMVPPELVPKAQGVMDEKKRRLLTIAQHQEMARQAEQLRAAIERRFGTKLTPAILAVVHTVSWVTRPIRKAVVARGLGKTWAGKRRES